MSRVLKLPSITTRKPQTTTATTTATTTTTTTATATKAEKDEEYPFSDKIGQRVSIPSMNLTGILRYVGEPQFKKGVWAGIELADSQGKNDGSVQGVRYFTCPPDCGIFIGVGKIVAVAPPPPPPPSSLTPPAPIVKPSTSTSTRRSNLPLIPKPHASSSSSSSSNSKASKTMIKRPGSRTPSQSTVPISKKPSKTLTHKPSKTFTKRSHHLRVSSVPSESTPAPSSTPPPPAAQANSTIANSNSNNNSNNSNNINNITSTTPTNMNNTTPKRESLKNNTSSPSPQMVKRDSTRSIPSSYTATPPPPPSPPIQYEEEIQLLKKQLEDSTDELDKMKREKEVLLTQMKSKETAWERLVSSKESLSLQVEEKQEQHQRTQRELDQLKLQLERLELDLADRDASIAKNIRDDEKQSQDKRRIERLENLVRELQNQLQSEKDHFAQTEREHAGMLDQVRREVTAGESMTAALEKECADLRRAGIETISACEQSIVKLNDENQHKLNEKDEHIRQLNHIITELKRKQSILFDDEEGDIDVDAMLKSAYSEQEAEESDQRHRLEEQLELTMAELDHERLVIKSMVNEMEQLKAEAIQLRQQKSVLEDKYMALQADFEKELQDKKRLIEEADAAFEAQARAEDEHYQMKLEKMAIEKELNYYREEEKFGNNSTSSKHGNGNNSGINGNHINDVDADDADMLKKDKQELINMNKQLEKDYMKLMDEMLLLEKQMEQGAGGEGGGGGGDSTTTASLQSKIEKLEKENENHRHSLSQLELEKKTQVNQLSKDLAELESLVENKVFGEADLEEKLEIERSKVKELEKEIKRLKSNNSNQRMSSDGDVGGAYKNTPLSPTATTTATEDDDDDDEVEPLYCELCDEAGHDLLQCRAAELDNDKLYCENCDDYGLHTTDDCPNQDETF